MLTSSPGTILRKLMTEECLMAIGAFNGLVGRLLAQKGFKACYVSGGAISASRGLPDIGLINANDISKVVNDIYLTTRLPIIADADTGFGEAEMCAKTIWTYHQAGAAGCHLEDQIFPKKCGHLEGKRLISAADMCKKINIAVKARNECSKDFLICARTDARAVGGLCESLSRAKEYIKSGADMIFPEGLLNEGEFQTFSQEIRKLYPKVFLLANMTEFGKTQYIPFNVFSKHGYNMVIYPVTTLRVAMKAIAEFIDDFKRKETVEHYLDKMQRRGELYELLNYNPSQEWIFPNPTMGK